VRRSDNLTTFLFRLSWNLGASTSWNPQGLSRPVMGLLYLYLFTNSLCTAPWEWKENYQHGLDAEELEFLRSRGCLTNPFRTLSLCFRVIGKTPGIICRNNFVKKNCLHRQSREYLGKMWLNLPFVQVSRSVEQNVHTTFFFPNPVSEFEELQSWGCSKIMLVILDAIRR